VFKRNDSHIQSNANSVYLDEKLSWWKHVKCLEPKLLMAADILYQLKNYVCSGISWKWPFTICDYLWGNTSFQLLNKLQVKQNKLIRLVANKPKRKTKLLPLYVTNNLKIDGIYKFEIAKLQNKKFQIFFIPTFVKW